jgi:hypothetical protein
MGISDLDDNNMVNEINVYAVATDPIYIGTGGYTIGRVDNTIVKDPTTKIPKIPGSSLAGTWRYYVALKLFGLWKEEIEELEEDKFKEKDQRRFTFIGLAGADISGYQTDREKFIGKYRTYANPLEVEKGVCENYLSEGGNPCGVLQTDVLLNVGEEKYDANAQAVIALLKYGSGMPFYRIEKLQKSMGIPLPSSTQFEIVDKLAGELEPAYLELLRHAAQGDVIYNDDTTMKILTLMQEKDPQRKGIYTTGILSTTDDHQIALFFTGRQHAGENLNDLLAHRLNHSPPIQMCDALSRNIPKDFKSLLANCLAHGRRSFVEILQSFPDECRHVLEILAQVYNNDQIAKEQNMPAEERLRFHQDNSGPLMKSLNLWFHQRLDQKLVEPNSGLGQAIRYMIKHWDALTLFLKVPNAPLDNNLCEQALKKAILHRKNSLFYKTEHGARVGDLFMSLIHTCNLNNINPFDYLATLQKHALVLATCPQKWMPWNYISSITENQPS